MKVRMLCGIIALCFSATAGQVSAQEEDAQAYALSMAGALINNWCGSNFEAQQFISIHACNYQLAQRYNQGVSSGHFNECARANGGDIIKIADCMLLQFEQWIAANPLPAN